MWSNKRLGHVNCQVSEATDFTAYLDSQIFPVNFHTQSEQFLSHTTDNCIESCRKSLWATMVETFWLLQMETEVWLNFGNGQKHHQMVTTQAVITKTENCFRP